jgi:hypothetical protein
MPRIWLFRKETEAVIAAFTGNARKRLVSRIDAANEMHVAGSWWRGGMPSGRP